MILSDLETLVMRDIEDTHDCGVQYDRRNDMLHVVDATKYLQVVAKYWQSKIEQEKVNV